MEQRRKASISIDDLARHVALSKGSVSRILNGKGGAFSEATRRRVEAAAAEIGYRPSAVAKALARGRTGIVSLCLSGPITPFLAQVSQSFTAGAADQGWALMVNVYEGRRTGAHPEALTGVADGLLLHDTDPLCWPTDAMAAALQPRDRSTLPPIVMTGAFGARADLDHVIVDLEPGATDAVRYLVSNGHRRILYLSTNAGLTEDPRRTGYLSVVRDAGVPVEMLECGVRSRHGLRQQLRAYVGRYGCPEAIFCHNDDAAVAAFWALTDLGRRIPDDVALVGCDGIEDLDYLPYRIPTIVQPIQSLVVEALGFLNRRLQAPDAPLQRSALKASFQLPDAEPAERR